jgi:beta-N-acetylhexosaminidase
VAAEGACRLSDSSQRLSNREVAARLTWITAAGTELDETARQLLELGAGGLVLFERNIGSVEQVAQLCASARAAAAGPLRIAIDQEGGHIIRLREPVTRMPSLMTLGATRSARLAFEVARVSGLELRAIGIDTVLGPVLDLAVDRRSVVVGSRSFGSAPALVGRLGAAMITGYHASGILAIAKHFPGHGRTALDSHYDVPVVSASVRELLTTDLAPYRSAIDAGVDGIMTSHCIYSALDDKPATLSRPILEKIARRELGYRGLLLTDGLVMDAIAHEYGIEGAAVAALIAGVDAVMPLARETSVVAAIAAGLQDRSIDAKGAAGHLKRAAGLDRRLRAVRPNPKRDAGTSDGSEAARSIAEKVADRSLTLVDGTPPRIRASEAVLLLELPFDRASPVEDQASGHSAAAILQRVFPRLVHVRLESGRLSEAGETFANHLGPAVLLTRDQHGVDGLRELAVALARNGRLMHVALRSPRDLVISADIGAVRIAAYADTPPTIAALGAKLVSGGPWLGRLPVPGSWVSAPETATAPVA